MRQRINVPRTAPLSFSLLRTVHIFTQIGGKTRKQIYCMLTQTHTHSVTQSCSLHHKPLSVWCRTAWLLVSSPRRPALSERLAETDWHLAFRTPQSFQAEYTGLFQWREREKERLVLCRKIEKRARMKYCLKNALKSRKVWRNEQRAGQRQTEEGQTLSNTKRKKR